MVWEDTSNLPFADDVREFTKNTEWDKYEWQVLGLPVPFAKFVMSGGKTLYISELPDGRVKLRRLTDFTGQIAMSGMFLAEDNKEVASEFNYFVSFVVTICKGEVVEVELANVHKQPIEEYKQVMADFKLRVSRLTRISRSWWFYWLYRPWSLVVRSIGIGILWILKFFKDVVVWVVSRLTPL